MPSGRGEKSGYTGQKQLPATLLTHRHPQGGGRHTVPRVKVKLFAIYYEAAGTRELEVDLPEGATVLDLAKLLEEKFPKLRGELVEDGRISEEARVLINGRNIEWLEKEKTKLHDGDVVAFFPPAAGG
ncbi:hypothetical protein Pdsh_10035 [Pyrodictium delaneyi]|uniref:Molybdopterin synthase sulfur carrier subunit n=1 Tax=Pyrodictium delaneyi TaxID=1273541 RepID=A0A211YMM8_9CREN|nr:hypothetical protein Pdsh_10035 [Pyrodictium delaneyi]